MGQASGWRTSTAQPPRGERGEREGGSQKIGYREGVKEGTGQKGRRSG